MRAITILLAMLAFASCDDNNNNKKNNHHSPSVFFEPLSPSPAIAVRISPSPLPIVTIPTISCPLVRAFSTNFNLIIVPAGGSDLFMDRVTFRLLDGSNIGGPAVTIPRPELDSMFGSTKVRGNRAFAFRPQFGCGTRRPFSIVGDIRLVDPFGTASNVTVTATF